MSTRMVHGRWILAVLLGAIPLVAQNAPPNATTGVRRPGGGAGLDYKAYDAATLDRGKATFQSQCGFCHGSNARGGESGPDLVRSVLVRSVLVQGATLTACSFAQCAAPTPLGQGG